MILAVFADKRGYFGNGDIGCCFGLELFVVDDDLGMEDFLPDAFVEVVGDRADEHALCKVGNLRGRDQALQLRIGRSRHVVVRHRMRLAQLHDLAETLRERACRVAHDLPREDIAYGVDDDLRLLLPVVAFQLRKVLKAQADGDLVRAGRGDEVVQPPDIDRRQLVDDERRLEFPFLVDKPDKTRIIEPQRCTVDALTVGIVAHAENFRLFGVIDVQRKVIARKHPRNSDNAGLGDWEVMRSKLPGGIPALVQSAKKAGVKFGIWIEPEMVNPKSELFEKHPDWAIQLPNRETYYYRNQLVLDLSNPKVQDFVYGVVDKILTENPEVAFFKWDCNSPITNIYSPYLKNKQGQLYIDHVRGIYNVLKRVKDKYPNVPMMLCSGGGARCDYEALKYYTEFWCSDNTDPIERLFIQWGFSQIFPAKAMCAHVTSWNKKTSVKFRTDVASMCKLGFDLGLKELNADEQTYCQNAVANWTRLKKVILDGDQYRLVSPYDGNHMSLMYTSLDKNKAVLYTYDIHPRFGEKLLPVKLQGLDAKKMYKVKEINLMPNSKSNLAANENTYSGDYLMKVGINAFTTNQAFSRVIELTAE